MKKTAILLLSIFLLSCEGESIESESIGDFNIELIFEKDGIKMYRFHDEGRCHYFTSKGETISTYSTGGKHPVTRTENINATE